MVAHVYGEVIIHIQHPWADDSARASNPIYIQSDETGWHPGATMFEEGGNWYTYTLKTATPTSNSRIEIMSAIPSQHYQYDQSEEYQGGSSQLVLEKIFETNPTVNEVWITVPDLSSWPQLQFTPPPGKVIYLFKPWDLGGAGITIDSLVTTKMRGVKERCGWFRYNHYGTTDELRVRFFNSLDSTLYSVTGLGDSSFIDLSIAFTTGDTVWIAPNPLPDGPPEIYHVPPDIIGECGTITLAAKLRDIGEHPDFGIETCFRHARGLVEKKLSQDGKVIQAADTSSCVSHLDWFEAQDFGNGYTNEMCYNLSLRKNEEGLYEYDTDAFFPVDDFTHLDPAGTIPNPNYGLQSGHNFHFTMELGCEFEYVKGQTFYFRGDDDVWVFIDSQLVVDIGGIHGPIEGVVDLDTLGLTEGETYSFKLFFAERHCCGSNFRMVTSINLRTSSRLFYIEHSLSDGIVQYDMYEKITKSNLSCDFDELPTDTQKAVVEYYIEGPPFSDPQRLVSGISYGGITISPDFGAVVIDETSFQGLPPGNYAILFYSSTDRTQGGVIPFFVPEVLKPPLISNPVIDAAFYSDNGFGMVNRAEIYFEKDLAVIPDSILLSWPSILNRKIVHRGGEIIPDTADNKHITVILNEPFERDVTTYSGTNRLGISYTYDTTYAVPLDVVPFRLADSIGPLIKEAFLLERTGAGDDTLILTFTEPVIDSTIIGNSLLLLKADTSITLTVTSVSPRADSLVVIVSSVGVLSATFGDSLQINSSGPFTDTYGNHGHPANRPVPLSVRKAPANLLHAYYRDIDADGEVDNAVLVFDKKVDISGVTCVFAWSNANTTELLGADRFTSGKDDNEIMVDLKNAFVSSSALTTSGVMNVLLEFSEYPTVKRSGLVEDSVAPVIVSAIYAPGFSVHTSLADTLTVTFSECVSEISTSAPFAFRTRDGKDYKITLESLSHDCATASYLVKTIDGVHFPSQHDSIWIDRLSGISDIRSNVQSNAQNRRALLHIKPVPLQFTFQAGPNPFRPKREQVVIQVDPSVKTREMIQIQAQITIIDQVGNVVFSGMQRSDTSASPVLSFHWDGHNLNGRIAGSGMYLAIIHAKDLKLQSSVTQRLYIGVIRE